MHPEGLPAIEEVVVGRHRFPVGRFGTFQLAESEVGIAALESVISG
jgi:hypothetical protein